MTEASKPGTPTRVGLSEELGPFGAKNMLGPYECYACGKMTKGTRSAKLVAVLEDDDGRLVYVGPDCHKKTRGPDGFKPPRGGPRLFFNQARREEWLARNMGPNDGR